MNKPGVPVTADEFLPLPFYGWISRPESLPLDDEEIATALFLDQGRLDQAAARLKVDQRRLKKAIRRNAGLRRLLERLGCDEFI
jgi:hypothetical protein